MTGFVNNRTTKFCLKSTWLLWANSVCEKQCDDCKKTVLNRQEQTQQIIKNL